MEKSMEQAIRADYGSIKQIVDKYYDRKEREDDEKKVKRLRKKLEKEREQAKKKDEEAQKIIAKKRENLKKNKIV